ncbi:MAG: hypothetical protein Q9197_001592 [Variospora fuerteventurae]
MADIYWMWTYENNTINERLRAYEPTEHSYSSSNASPTLKVSLTNHATRPITIYNEYMILFRVLAEGKLIIYDRTSDTVVDQMKTHFCEFAPPTKVHVPLPERMFYTLYPMEPVVFTATFGRNKSPSQPVINPHRPRGVHGLQIGHEYVLRPGKGWGYIRWWEWGEKDEVINPPGRGKLDGREILYKRRKTPHPRLLMNVEELPEIEFRCVE